MGRAVGDGAALPDATRPHSEPGVGAIPAALLAAGIAFALYLFSLAPGLTWAHNGADGGELLAAAVVNGVAHPPGYPLYTMLLQGWLAAVGALSPGSDLAWRGNLLSALCSALSTFVTVITAYGLLSAGRLRAAIAALAGLLWATTPLLWSQSVITEVYALHALIVALLGWVALVGSARRMWLLALPVALGVAHHLTLILFLPSVLYLVWSREQCARRLFEAVAWLVAGALAGSLLYVRIPYVAQGSPPVNWGFATDASGLWWLVSGSAYRAYVFGAAPESVLQRIASWGYTLAAQYTLIGLILALWGFAWWDQHRPTLRNFSLIWFVPISIYTIGYASRDSEIYLIPVVWLMALWLAVGMERCAAWMGSRWHGTAGSRAALVAFVALASVAIPLRWSTVSLRGDSAARDFVSAAAATVLPNAIVVSRGDAETFALWYGTWASGEIARAAPGIILVNDALYQFEWYGRLQETLHPGVSGVGESAEALIEKNSGQRPVFRAGDMQEDPAAVPGLYPDFSP